MIDEAWRIERIRSMDDSGQIETAYTTIDNLYGGSDFPRVSESEPATSYRDLRFDIQQNFDDAGDALAILDACGEWACEVALNRYLVVMEMIDESV